MGRFDIDPFLFTALLYIFFVEVDEGEDDLCPEDYYDWPKEGSGEVEACEESQFGCCSDGVTAAEDADGSGCPSLVAACEDSEFGCCPDGNTTAQGADFEGCPPQPCSDTMYGCCADGVRPAAGSDGEGCERTTEAPEIEVEVCADTEHECCLDGVQPASGPDFAGCPEYGSYTETCDDSAFGCCPDGVSAAVGPFYAGCAYQRQIARQSPASLHMLFDM